MRFVKAILHFFQRPAFERYTPAAREAVFLAIQEAQKDGCARLTAEYLTLGVCRRGLPGGDLEGLLRDLRTRSPGSAGPVGADLPVDGSAMDVFRAAEALADKSDCEVDVLHLLGGELKSKTAAAGILNAHGVRFEDVRFG